MRAVKKHLHQQHISEDFITLVKQREYKVENRLNRLKVGVIVIFACIDGVAMAMNNILPDTRIVIIGVISIAVCIAYFSLVHHVTTSHEYRPWLKYLISTVDFTLISGSLIAVHDQGVLQVLKPEYMAIFLLFFTVLLIFINALRFGKMIILYNTALGSGLSIYALSKAGLPLFFILYAIPFLLLSGLLASWISGWMTNLYVDLKKRQRLMRFLSKEIIESIDNGTITLQLGGEQMFATILFVDVRGFSQLSEDRSPVDVVSLLNEYFTTITEIIHTHNGTIDKFIGDAVMALFGIPVRRDDDAQQALQAAKRIHEALPGLNARLVAMGFGPIALGTALHTGVVVAGNIGSDRRMDYTVIGDAVNVTARIEELNKKYHTPILFSESTKELSREKDFEFVDEVVLRGRHEPVKIFTVKGYPGIHNK